MKRRQESPAEDKLTRNWPSATLVCSVAANVLLWAAFPPWRLAHLAWIAPAFWIYLAMRQRLPGRRPYFVLWATSAVHWFVLLEGIGRAFWANYFGLALLASYLGLYVVVFVALTRVALQRWRIPVVVAAPVVWSGLELARGHLLTGFSLGLLGHTMAKATHLIQIADFGGAYVVGFLIVFVASCLARMVPVADKRWDFRPLGLATAALVGAMLYGVFRMPTDVPNDRRLTVALIQGTDDTRFDTDLKAAQQRSVDTFNQYWRLTLAACEQRRDLDLIVWPESVFSATVPEILIDGDVVPPANSGLSRDQVQEILSQRVQQFQDKVQAAAATFNSERSVGTASSEATYLLVGTDSVRLRGTEQMTYNAALLIDPTGQVVERYFKNHRVMFGEYVPFGDRFPWLYGWMPIGRGLTPGDGSAAMRVREAVVAPSICFEVAVPHLLRRHVNQLKRQGQDPRVLINLTNDGWFWGSAILDLQLASATFRAVELRRPMLIAANTGLTAWADDSGRIRALLPRRQEGFIIADVPITSRHSFYEGSGDWLAGICLLVCVALAGTQVGGRLVRKPSSLPGE